VTSSRGMVATRNWTLDEALAFLRRAIPEADRAGYVLGLYGSVVMHGIGRDLDILAEPKRFGTNAYALLYALDVAAGAPLLRSTIDAGILADSCLLRFATGAVLDLRIGR
jgi:hypothetical protein